MLSLWQPTLKIGNVWTITKAWSSITSGSTERSSLTRSVAFNIQLKEARNPDTSGPHWYCDALACDFRAKRIFLCEISYELRLANLVKRLRQWHENWPAVCHALARDSHLPSDWPVHPWLFVPEKLVDFLKKRLLQIPGTEAVALNFVPRITPLEKVLPWHYKSWDRIFEEGKPEGAPNAAGNGMVSNA
jgi:hypothetical protein